MLQLLFIRHTLSVGTASRSLFPFLSSVYNTSVIPSFSTTRQADTSGRCIKLDMFFFHNLSVTQLRLKSETGLSLQESIRSVISIFPHKMSISFL